MLKLAMHLTLLAACTGTDAPVPADAPSYPKCVYLGCSATAMTRECAATGVCYCDIGTKDIPNSVRCSF